MNIIREINRIELFYDSVWHVLHWVIGTKQILVLIAARYALNMAPVKCLISLSLTFPGYKTPELSQKE